MSQNHDMYDSLSTSFNSEYYPVLLHLTSFLYAGVKAVSVAEKHSDVWQKYPNMEWGSPLLM